MMLLLASLSMTVDPICNDLKRDIAALELFLQDQEDYEKYCPKLPWKQPEIEVYKKELISQLPENCIK
jgi:hypothetical protein